MKQFYVYIHFKPDGTPFYVGKAHGRRGYLVHVWRNNYHSKVVAKYGRENIQVMVFNQPDELTALQKEIELIAQLISAGHTLTNMTQGGEGVVGASEEVKAKQRAAKLGKKATELAKANMKAAKRGINGGCKKCGFLYTTKMCPVCRTTYRKQYRLERKDFLKQYNAAWHQANRERANALSTQWNKNNPDKTAKASAKAYRKRRAKAHSV